MARSSKLVDNELIEKAELGLKQLGNYGKLSVKLRAVIACGDNSITQVAKIFKISRFALNEWIKTVKSGSVSDLMISPGRGRNAIVPEFHHSKIKSWLDKNPQLTTDMVQMMISKDLGIELGRTATYNLIRNLGLSYITPRPSHHKKDESLHEAFKKNFKRSHKKKIG